MAMNANTEILVGLSIPELEALADSFLAPAAQLHLDELFGAARKKNSLPAMNQPSMSCSTRSII